MYTLYIDTHSDLLMLALSEKSNVISIKKVNSEKHTDNAVNLIDELLKSVKITLSDINLIIVINGPGSFTGVRIGVVIAKIMAYTQNIQVKSLTYLEAMAINYNREVNVGIKDKNGVFIGEFKKDYSLKKDYFYLTHQEFLNYKKECIFDIPIDLERIYKYLETKENVNPHLLNPLYVKKLGMIP